MSKNSYLQGIIISLSLITTGFIAEIIGNGAGVSMPSWPINILILFVFVFYIFVLHFLWKSDFKKWLSSVPSTVTAIGAYSILVVLMGLIPQVDQNSANWVHKTGLSHINRSWEFLFLSIYLLTILGLVILRRVKKFNLRNIAFLLNHLGIFIVISAASLASGDLQRLTLPLSVGESSNYAFADKVTLKKLPFTVKLDSFEVHYFSPQLIIFNHQTKQILNEAGIDYTIEKNKQINFNNYTFIVKEFYQSGFRTKNGFIEKDTLNSESAALIEIQNATFSKTAWVSSGNYSLPSMGAILNDNIAISLSLPQDKKYISTIDIVSFDNKILKNLKILVNKPYKFAGYNIYQQSYEKSLSETSDISILELVKDPWLPVIYVGLFMLLLGAILLFWLGKKI